MIIVACPPCNLALRIIGNPIEVDMLVGKETSWWPSAYPCPVCGKHATGMKEMEADPNALRAMSLIDLSPHEAFVAFNGLGLPTERVCRKEEIEELFKMPIRRVVGQNTQTQRFILEHIEFWDGTRLYLGAAPGGAIVYKISAPPNYTKGVADV